MPPKAKSKARLPDGAFCDLTAERGVKLYYETSGPNDAKWQGDKEEVLFMILGSTADLRKTADQQYVNQSVSMYKILTYDHRNTGQSTIKDEPCTMEDYADDAAALLKTVIPEKLPVCVIGISFGGMVAQHLAIRHPELIKKLVLCCCATGGEGGMSYPIHDWYAPGTTIEERVTKKIFQANTDRTPECKEQNKTEWQMSLALLSRDEKVGIDEPLRMEGITRQLEARRNHNTWDKISQLGEMEVLVLGSGKDNITPPEIMENMVKRIGKCQSKLDFGWGHAFIAADTAAMPYVNNWLRQPIEGKAEAAEQPAAAAKEADPWGLQVWKVVGGADKGGIVVRLGEATTSAQAETRLSTGALVEQLAVKGDRLNYRLLKGDGPATGWAAIKLSSGKDLLVKTDERP